MFVTATAVTRCVMSTLLDMTASIPSFLLVAPRDKRYTCIQQTNTYYYEKNLIDIINYPPLLRHGMGSNGNIVWFH